MKKTILYLLFISMGVAAQIPHTFKAGETAKAADVNENILYLMARIDSLKQTFENKAKADSVALAAADSTNQLPKGAVAAFLTEPGADGYLPGSNSTWLLAAGQGDVNGVKVPDMRARFLRGIDFTVTGRDRTNLDPDGKRLPGSQQSDAFQGHTHLTAIQEGVSSGSGGGYAVAFDRTHGWAAPFPISSPWPDSSGVLPRTANETRPANIAVFWYVKVK